jgi:hypothetical protein
MSERQKKEREFFKEKKCLPHHLGSILRKTPCMSSIIQNILELVPMTLIMANVAYFYNFSPDL